MQEPVIISNTGLTAHFNDGSTVELPWELTLKDDSTEGNKKFSVQLDLTGKTIPVEPPTKKRLVMIANILLIDHWRSGGRSGKPKKVDLLE